MFWYVWFSWESGGWISCGSWPKFSLNGKLSKELDGLMENIIIIYLSQYMTQSHHILAWKVCCIHFFLLSIHFGSHFLCFLSLINHGAKAVAALFGWKALFLQALHGPEICVARHHHVLPRIEARRTSQAGDKGHEGDEGDEGDESTTQPMACSCICSHIWSYFQLYAQYANFMVVHTHQIHPYTLHRFTAQVAMSVRPLVNHIHQRVSFDRKDFGPPHICFPRWKVPELVGKVENMLPECQSLGKSAQKLWWKAIRNLSWNLSTPRIESMERTQSQILSVIEVHKHMFNMCDNMTLYVWTDAVTCLKN